GAGQHQPADSAGAMPGEVPDGLATTDGVPDERDAAQVETGQKLTDVVGERVVVQAPARIVGAAVTAPVKRDAAVAAVGQPQHELLPHMATPALAGQKHDRR